MLRITAKLELSDHDGYCSGGENEYSSHEITCRTFIGNSCPKYIQDTLTNLPIGDIDFNSLKNIDFTNYLRTPEVSCGGSGYCSCCDKTLFNNLDGHDYRYTIINIIKIPLTTCKFVCIPPFDRFDSSLY
tara:strand:+ start:114 stop:503 length:390 start_codon:yes stop_codon:yes gene_type:complete